jgi:hypothetical protein
LNRFSEMLHAIDNNDGDWYRRTCAQSPQAAKEADAAFTPLVTLRYISALKDAPHTAAQSAYLLMTTAERVNPYVFPLSKHKDLLFRLLASCGLGDLHPHEYGEPTRHPWNKPQVRRRDSNALIALLAKHNPEANDDELDILVHKLDRDGWLKFIQACGIQSDKAEELIGDYDTLTTTITAQKADPKNARSKG